MNTKEIQREHQRLLGNLRLIQKTTTVREMCELLDISPKTWTNRMKEPWKLFSIDDFRAIARYCKVDFVQLVDGELKLR
ncbi:MAG: hypothetical protein J6P14_01235 [Ruminococcus sp.]|nr:hypothetical protein [Ruminococcus sp.]